MPEQQIYAPFILREDFNKYKYIKEQVDEIRTLAHKELDEAKSIDNRVFKNICLFSVLDCFAQEYANYPTDGVAKVFCDFVLRFQDKFDYLEQIEPVTLFYDYEPNIKRIVKYPELAEIDPEYANPELEISLGDFGLSDGQNTSEIMKLDQTKVLIGIIERDQDAKRSEIYKKKHTLIQLIYKMRSKAVHELSHLGGENKWEFEDSFAEPFYRDKGRLYECNGNIVSDDVIELVIPSIFIYNLVKNAIDNYLDYCLQEQRLPFENNSNFKRTVDITWRD